MSKNGQLERVGMTIIITKTRIIDKFAKGIKFAKGANDNPMSEAQSPGYTPEKL